MEQTESGYLPLELQLDPFHRGELHPSVWCGLEECGKKIERPVWLLAREDLNRDTFRRLLEMGVLRLTELDRPWWIDPRVMKELEPMRETLDRHVPGWDRSLVASLLELYHSSSPKGICNGLFYYCTKSTIPFIIHHWLIKSEWDALDTVKEYHLLESEIVVIKRAYAVYQLLYERHYVRDGNYVFRPDYLDESSGSTTDTLVYIDGSCIRLPLHREAVEELVLPIREGWNVTSKGKSARTVV